MGLAIAARCPRCPQTDMQQCNDLEMARMSQNTHSESEGDNGEDGHGDGYWVCDSYGKVDDDDMNDYEYERVHVHL